ncbi:MAG: FAD-dependent oxidoreductase [Desulfobacteraceae bacterium]
MERIDYLIAGASAAGMAAAHTIRSRDPQGRIVLFTEEPDQPYFRPMIPYLVSGQKRPKTMGMAGFGPYTAPGIEVRTESRIKDVDFQTRQITLANGDQAAYEKILFATGSRPHIPPDIRGTKTPGVFALRTLDDARQMAARAKQTEHAVLLGGGLLNLKAAFALLEKGIRVTLVVYSPEILSQLMEPDDAFLLRNALDGAGLEIKTKASAQAVLSGKNGVEGVLLADSTRISCEMVCIGKGVRPNVEFLTDSGIELEKGIRADRYTRCTRPHAYAAGDVAVTHDPVSGRPVMTALWTNAVEMGRCAGLNMAGIKTAYTGTFGILNATQVANLPFVSMGEVHTRGKAIEVHARASSTAYRKMVFSADGTRLVGAVLVGDITNAGLYRHVIQGGRNATPFKREIVDHTLHWGHLLPPGNNRLF